MLQRHQQGVAEKGHQHVGFHSLFQLMKQRPDRQLTLERAKCSFHFRQLYVFFPKVGRRVACYARLVWRQKPEQQQWLEAREGAYLLRTNARKENDGDVRVRPEATVQGGAWLDK